MENRPGKDKPDDINDPDKQNAEQNEEGTQAQDVASDALHLANEALPLTESGSPSDPADLVPRDVPDLIETMEGMLHSGIIDQSAFDGEDMDDAYEDDDDGEGIPGRRNRRKNGEDEDEY